MNHEKEGGWNEIVRSPKGETQIDEDGGTEEAAAIETGDATDGKKDEAQDREEDDAEE